MKFSIIGSGSKGNMTYVETEQAKILIDAGISYRDATNRIDFSLDAIDAIVVTHEHTDHVKFLFQLAKKMNAVIYMEKESLNRLLQKEKKIIEGIRVSFLEANTQYTIKDLTFLTLRLSHDATSCLGFVFENKTKRLGYIADTGFLPIPYIAILQKIDALIIEANHDIEMLHQCNRPWFLKERILSVRGHMSNYICGQVINSILEAKQLKMVFLAHISEECNTEECAIDTIMEAIEGEYIPNIRVAKQKEATPLIEV